MDEGLLNDLLECSVCLERLDTSSRVLPCQHTFCLKCLKVIVESHKELRCPECRVLVETKVEELPPNVLLMRILEGMRNSAPRKMVNATQRTSRSGHSQSQQGQQPTRDGKQLPPHARAMYDYISKEPGDLSFKKGETILLQKKLDSVWYQGECSGRTGLFPISFVQVVVPLPIPTALCKAMYDFRMTAPDEEGCLAFDKGAIITVHRRVDENWAEGRLEQRVGIFPIAFVEFNQPANQIIYGTPLNRPVPPIPDMARPGHSEHRHHAQHPHRYQQISMSTPASGQSKYQNVATMSQSHPNFHATQMLAQQQQILVPQTVTAVSHGGLVSTSAVPRNIVEPTQTKHSIDLIHFTNTHSKAHQGTMGLQSVSRIGENYDRLRTVKYDNHNSTPVHKADATYQNVRTHEHFPVSVANFNANNVSSDSSSSMNTASVGISLMSTPNTSSNSSSSESTDPSMPGSPDNNTDRNATVVAANVTPNEAEESNEQEFSLNTSMGVMSLNESSTATNTSLNVSLPPSESPKPNVSGSSTQVESPESTDEVRLDAPSSSKTALRSSGPESLLFGLGLQAALSPSHGKDGNYMVSRLHRDHHHRDRDKRHSLTPSSHLQSNHTQNRHSAEIVATSLLDAAERRRRRSRSSERGAGGAGGAGGALSSPAPPATTATPPHTAHPALPATYLALYPYRPQKPDELELKKGAMYTVTERCRDGWFKGCSERSQRFGVFPGNYVAPAGNIRSKADKSGVWASGAGAASPAAAATPATPAPAASPAPAPLAPDAPPRARTPPSTAQPLTYPWSSQIQSQQQSTPRSDKQPKEKTKTERSTISTGVNLMKRLAAMKKCKSPPAVGYSIDNPVFEDTTLSAHPAHPAHHRRHALHVRSGSCPSQLLRALPAGSGGVQMSAGVCAGAAERARHKERPSALALHDHLAHRQGTEGPWQSQHRKSQSLDVTATRKDRHHSQPVKERFRCIVPYPPNSEYELELKVDDIVVVSKKRGDGWYKGTLQRTGRTGLFPASFVQSCPSE